MTPTSPSPHTLSRTQVACACLAASAFMLAALLLASLAGRFAPLTAPAEASMVQTADDYVLLTAQTRNGEESLFVLDNRERKLLIYRTDVSRGRMAPYVIEDIDSIFSRRPQRR